MTRSANWHVPSHVPPDLVVDFDLFSIPPGLVDPVDKWHDLVAADVPRIFWSPRNGGHWTFLRYEDIREGYRNYESFSNRDTPIPPVEGWPVFQPQSVDPPDHAKAEVIVALREWLPRIPEFWIDEREPVEIFAGPVMGFRKLPLLWP